jgi:hypothetical protein
MTCLLREGETCEPISGELSFQRLPFSSYFSHPNQWIQDLIEVRKKALKERRDSKNETRWTWQKEAMEAGVFLTATRDQAPRSAADWGCLSGRCVGGKCSGGLNPALALFKAIDPAMYNPPPLSHATMVTSMAPRLLPFLIFLTFLL